MKLTTHLHLVPRLRSSEAVLSVPQITSWHVVGQVYLLPFNFTSGVMSGNKCKRMKCAGLAVCVRVMQSFTWQQTKSLCMQYSLSL